jgi:hypothetical protein
LYSSEASVALAGSRASGPPHPRPAVSCRLSRPERVTPTSSRPDSRLPTSLVLLCALDTLSNPPTLGSTQVGSNRAGRDGAERGWMGWDAEAVARLASLASLTGLATTPRFLCPQVGLRRPTLALPSDRHRHRGRRRRRLRARHCGTARGSPSRAARTGLPDHGSSWSPGKPVEFSA